MDAEIEALQMRETDSEAFELERARATRPAFEEAVAASALRLLDTAATGWLAADRTAAREAILFRIAWAYERETRWCEQRPPVAQAQGAVA